MTEENVTSFVVHCIINKSVTSQSNINSVKKLWKCPFMIKINNIIQRYFKLILFEGILSYHFKKPKKIMGMLFRNKNK